MKATGIVRRIDELGRIVIPKEIRRIYKIREGTPLEIFSGDNGELVLKKFSPILELEDISKDACKSVFEVLEQNVFICDKDTIISCEGSTTFKKNYLHKNITLDLEKIIENRKAIILNLKDGANLFSLFKDQIVDFTCVIIVPILANGDTYGAMAIVGDSTFTNNEVKIIQTFTNFLNLQIE
ncbi:MAG: AbrB/MazE/SpoVT family DNA-binding domain-containing protein [Clostridiales bacterium]|nr:AbrB/MazE/SpoVT family DNA-binding domain-containing protein [Clostridiales bacterium]